MPENTCECYDDAIRALQDKLEDLYSTALVDMQTIRRLIEQGADVGEILGAIDAAIDSIGIVREQ